MNTQPQMFFIRGCADILPAWLLLPIPALWFLDSSIPFLSLLDVELFSRGEASEDEDGEEDFFDDELDESDIDGELVYQRPAPAAHPRERSTSLSFYMEGVVDAGSRLPYAIKGEEFTTDAGTIVSGELLRGAYAAVQGVIDENGDCCATIIVTDAHTIH